MANSGDHENELFRTFLNKFDNCYKGANYRWLKFCLCGTDVLPFSVLSRTDIVGMTLFNELENKGLISSTNTTLLWEIAELTRIKSAKDCLLEYKAASSKPVHTDGKGLEHTRKLLYQALIQTGEDDLRNVVAVYKLEHLEFENIWDVVFYLEKDAKLDTKYQSISKFATHLNGKAREILLGNSVISKVPTFWDGQDYNIREFLLKQLKSLTSDSKFTPPMWYEKFKIDIEHIFTDLSMINKGKGKTPAINLSTLKGIIKSTSACRVLIEGEAGVGKTTMLRFMAYNWANGKDDTFKDKLVFFVKVRNIDKGIFNAISDLVNCNHEEGVDPVVGLNEIKRYLERHSDEVVILLDGLDELIEGKPSPLNLFKKKIFGNSKVIITSRTGKADQYIEESDVHVIVTGFDDERIDIYIRQHFTYKNMFDFGKSLTKKLRENKTTHELCKTPMFLLAICTLWEYSDKPKSIPTNKSELFKHLFCWVLNQYIGNSCKDKKIKSFDKIPCKYKHAMVVLGKCMYESLKKNNICINKSDMEGDKIVIELALNIGIVYKVEPRHPFDHTEKYIPSHKLIAEAAAGIYLSQINKHGFIEELAIKEYELMKFNSNLDTAIEFAIRFLGCKAGHFLKYWISSSLSKCWTLIELVYNIVEKQHRREVENTIHKYISESDFESRITDVSKTFRKFLDFEGQKIVNEDDILQLINKMGKLKGKVLHFLNSQFGIKIHSENAKLCGRMIAHFLVAFENPCCFIQKNVYLEDEEVVKSAMFEFKQLGLVYTGNTGGNVHLILGKCHPLLIAHFLWNAKDLVTFSLSRELYLELGSAINYVSEENLNVIPSKLTSIKFEMNITMEAVKGASLASLLKLAPYIRELYFENCRLSGSAINDMISECCKCQIVRTELNMISLNNNNLSTIDGALLASLFEVAPNLRKLSIAFCRLSGEVINNMVMDLLSRNSVDLERLQIHNNNLKTIKGDLFNDLLQVFPNLTALGIANCQLPSDIMNYIVTECSRRNVVLT